MTTADPLTRVPATPSRAPAPPPLHGLTKATYVRLPNSRFGHLGAGDTPASLVEFTASGRYEDGDVALLVCAGSGFTISCVCVRMPTPASENTRFQIVHDFHPETELESQVK